ncbi:hypothetical protein [Candidatus Endoriftia persephonae]|uniref:Flagellar protein FliL n=1 Tax=Candidatus Endoriftia persephonae TaxID=393765 RepID=A0A9J6ZUC9_9GAMM|nr:hypothetical protein [Candidatus Endoriftia persephone]USF86390.1 hypothetical protein L0Y14_09555 [Candidatus Endoriftia persephone]
MHKYLCILLLMVLLSVSNAYAGFGSYDNPYSTDSVIAPIQIKGEGLFNLVISIQFLNEPYEKKPYESDEYKKFIKRLNIEWSGVALSQALQAKEQNINDLDILKSNIEAEINKLANKLKSKYSLNSNVEVVFSLSRFYLLKPRDN